MSKPALTVKRERGSYRAEIRDERGVWHYALGPTARDAEARLARSYALPSGMAGEIASADPYRLYPQGDSPYNPSILVQRRGLRVFDQMRADDQVKAALTFKKHAVFAAQWAVESPEGKPEDWEPAAFIREQLDQLEGTFSANLVEILSALDFGYSVTEKIFEEDGSQVVLRALKTRAPHAIDFRIDRHGNLDRDGILQWQGDGGLVAMPVEKFVIFRNMSEFGNPYGTSDLEAAYRAWWHKDHAYKWLGMLLERYGIPPIVAKYRHGSLNSTQLGELKDVLTNLQAATAAIVPFSEQADDLQFWTPELAGQVSQVFEPSIGMYNTDIARAILMPGLLGLTPESRVGSMARARVVFDVFLFVRDFLAGQVAEVAVNDQIIRPLVAMNFPGIGDEYPRFKLHSIDDNLRKEMFDVWVSMVGAGVVTRQPADEAHIRELLEFPARDEDTMEEEDDEPDPPEDQPDADEDADDDVDDQNEDENDDKRDAVQTFRSNVLPGRVPEGPPVDRSLTLAEIQIDIPALSQAMDRVERQGIAEIGPLMQQAADALVAKVKLRGVRAELTRPRGRALAEAFERLMTAAFTAGRQSVRGEIARTNDEPVTALDPADAIAVLRTKAFFITGIWEDRILARAREALWQSLKIGDTTQAAMARLRRALEEELSPWRLEVIVRTNTTEAFNTARLLEIRRSALTTQVQFSAILDARTSSICRHMDQAIFRRDDPALDRFSPPLHFNSFVSDTLVSTSGAIAAKATREYEGEIVSIRTASGKLLTGTPNHPILTDRGWIPLGRLDKGDRVVGCSGRDIAPVGQRDDEHVPARIEDVPVASWSAGGVVPRVMETAPVDFHGDGAGSKVCVVSADGLLWRWLYATRAKLLLEQLFVRANVPVSRVAFASHGAPDDDGLRLWLAPEGGMRGCGEVLAAFWAELLHAQEHGFAPVAPFYSRFVQALQYRGRGDPEVGRHVFGGLAGFVALHNLLDWQVMSAVTQLHACGFESAIDGGAGDTELLRNLMTSKAISVELDDVVEVEIEFTRQLVHCLQTTTGWYCANGLVASNCRSILVPVPPSLAVPDDELVTEAHKGRGLDLAQEGFV